MTGQQLTQINHVLLRNLLLLGVVCGALCGALIGISFSFCFTGLIFGALLGLAGIACYHDVDNDALLAHLPGPEPHNGEQPSHQKVYSTF